MKSVLLILTILCLPHLWAQTSPQTATPVDETQLRFEQAPAQETAVENVDLGVWDFIRMILVLGLMVGLIWGFVYLLKRVSQKPTEELEGVRLLATFTLSPSRNLYFVEIGNRVFVLSGAENGVQTITELDDQVLIDSLRLRSARQKPVAQPFWEMLKKAFGGGPSKMSAAPISQKEEFFEKQRDRLSKL